LSSGKKKRVIAIDGPAGAGKSTTARLVAKRLGFLYLDTGAMYRALALKILERGVNPNSSGPVEKLLEETEIEVVSRKGNCRVKLDGKIVAGKIRTPRVERIVSRVASYRGVRNKMAKAQRSLARKGNLVLEGRDTTTVVFPDADLKVYLTAGLDERAKRKVKAKGLKSGELGKVRYELSRRDRLDSKRKFGPLRKAKKIVEIDTTRLSIPRQVQLVVDAYHSRIS
jgi:cytidylate kinase